MEKEIGKVTKDLITDSLVTGNLWNYLCQQNSQNKSIVNTYTATMG